MVRLGFRLPEWDRCKVEVSNFAGSTSCHGVGRVRSSKSVFLKLAWALAVMLGFVMFITQLHQLIMNYMEKPTSTDQRIDFIPASMIFPSVTVCNPHKIRKTFLDSGKYPVEIIAYLGLGYVNYDDLVNLMFIQDTQVVHQKDLLIESLRMLHPQWKNFTTDHPDFDIHEFYLEAAPDCPSFVQSCLLDRVPTPKEVCCSFASTRLTQAGVCHDFSPMRSDGSLGWNGTFEITVNVSVADFTDFLISVPGPDNLDLLVVVHSDRDYPLAASGIYAASGFKSHYAINLEKDIYLPKHQWGMCEDNPKPLTFFDYYSSTNCYQNCLMENIYHLCGCIPVEFAVTGYPLCDVALSVNCILTNSDEAWNISYHASELCDCPNACDVTSYIPSLSLSTLVWTEKSNKSSYPYLVKAKSTRSQTEDMATVKVYYGSEMMKIRSQRKATSHTKIFSDIGGQMGLLLGASMLTVAEIIEFIVRVIIAWWSKGKSVEAIESELTTPKKNQPTASLSVRNNCNFKL